MTKFLNYQRDLEDAFKLDCSEEDLKTDKEAKKCYKQLKRYRKHTKRYHKFLRKMGFISDYKYKRRSNMRRNDNSSGGKSGGIGFVGLLTITFIVLKLLNVIKWSWLWVLAPIWIYAAFIVVIIIIAAIIAASN